MQEWGHDEPRSDGGPRSVDREPASARLAEVLGETFVDVPDRTAVLIVGAGLLRELAESERRSAWIEPDRRWGAFLSWTTLRRRLASSGEGGDPSVQVVRLLEPPAAHEMTLMQLGYRLRESRFRDLVTLDVDTTIEAALRAVGFVLHHEGSAIAGADDGQDGGASVEAYRILRRRLEARSTFVSLDGERTIRVWHPCGSVAEPETIRLAREDAPSRRIAFERAVAGYEERRSEFFRSWPGPRDEAAGAFRESLRAAAVPELAPWESPLRTWVDLFLSSDLVFAGTRLARSEHELWWALAHRSSASPAIERHRTVRALYLAAAGSVPAHLLADEVRLDVVEFASHRDLWDAVLRPVSER